MIERGLRRAFEKLNVAPDAGREVVGRQHERDAQRRRFFMKERLRTEHRVELNIVFGTCNHRREAAQLTSPALQAAFRAKRNRHANMQLMLI
jgi:hypothetical protein